MLQQRLHAAAPSEDTLTVSLARDENEVFEAQRLRFKVFAQEMCARVPGREQGIDKDRYDPRCEHLIVRDTQSGRVVGTYRLLTGANAQRIGGFYPEQEFDLTRLDLPLRCAAPAYAVAIPPLIKGYVRLGATMCGAPAWDPDFNTADLLMLLPMSRLTPRYARRFGTGVMTRRSAA